MDGYLGQEFRSMRDESLEWYELLHGHNRLKNILRVLARVWIAVSLVLTPVLKKVDRETLYDHLQRLFCVLPRRLALKLVGISAPSFYHRLHKLRVKCGLSRLSLCLKRHPLQLAVAEVDAMRALLSDVRFACWPLASIAHHARREGLLYASLSTWYKYSTLLGFKRCFPKPEQKTQGILSTAANQFLHVDTTFYVLPDGTKTALSFVSDNYSRMVLGWGVSQRHGAENVKKALGMAVLAIGEHHPSQISATLVADGGSENHAVGVGELIASMDKPKITKIVALRDIAYSNSPIEAINKIMKRYIRHGRPQSLKGLQDLVAAAVNDYNSIRPHCALGGLTPLEVYAQKLPSMDFSTQTKQAKAERKVQNAKGWCPKC